MQFSNANLAGHFAIVTGAGSGIGEAFAESLAAAGAQVAAPYHAHTKPAADFVDRRHDAEELELLVGVSLTAQFVCARRELRQA